MWVMPEPMNTSSILALATWLKAGLPGAGNEATRQMPLRGNEPAQAKNQRVV